MRDKKEIISSFIKHLGNSSVMDLLLKVIACEDTPDGSGVLEVHIFLSVAQCAFE